MDSQLSGVREMVSTAVDKIGEMINSGGSKHMCYLILLIVALFVFLYAMLSLF